MSKEKKKFGETKVGGWLTKVKDNLPELAGDVVDVIASPNPIGAITEKLLPKLKSSKSPVSDELTLEYEKNKLDFEKEMYSIEVRDRESARNREVELAKAGKKDPMMVITGIIGLVSFVFCIYAVVYEPSVRDNKLFVHLLGMIEGVVISNIFSYYYGTSKSSKDKTEMLKNK